MPALETLQGIVTAPSTTLTALTMASGNSLQIRNMPQAAKAHLVHVGTCSQVTGVFQIKSPRMHDQLQGQRHVTSVLNGVGLMPVGFGSDQTLESQDTLVALLNGSATSGDIEQAFMTIYYESLAGVEARLIDENALRLRSSGQIVALQVNVTPTAAGGWTGQCALNSTYDTLIANVDYAILGARCATSDVGAIRIMGAETGNLGVAVPNSIYSPEACANYFIQLSRQLGVPAIPVISGSNKGAILIDASGNENSAASHPVTIYLEKLAA